MDKKDILNNELVKEIHFIGIGGRSMSGLASLALSQGFKVTGSDSVESPYTKHLRELGVKITINQSADNIENPDLVVYTAAIAKDNPELVKAKELTTTVERSVFLGAMMKKYKCPIAVCGTHGKTTTTSMTSVILLEAGKNPTIHLGGDLPAINSNTHVGDFDYMVVEACEYVDSFLEFYPKIAAVTNIDLEHLDYFKDIEAIKESFNKFFKNVPSDGYVIANFDNKNVVDVVADLSCQVISYSILDEFAYFNARNITYDKLDYPTFDLYKEGEYLDTLTLKVPGRHNVLNALAAIGSAYFADCSIEDIKKGFVAYEGTKRRYDTIGVVDGIRIMEDVAHVPIQMSTLLASVRKITDKTVYAVFQPHTYTRTRDFLIEYVDSFENADKVIVCKIYPAREKDLGFIHGKDLVNAINKKYPNKAIYLEEFMDMAKHLKKVAKDGDVIIAMGSGDIWQFCDICIDYLRNN